MTQNTQTHSRLATGMGDFHRLSKGIAGGLGFAAARDAADSALADGSLLKPPLDVWPRLAGGKS